jgi:hypothetical protein
MHFDHRLGGYQEIIWKYAEGVRGLRRLLAGIQTSAAPSERAAYSYQYPGLRFAPPWAEFLLRLWRTKTCNPVPGHPDLLRVTYANQISALWLVRFSSQCTVSHIMMTSLRSKWAAGKARGGRMSKSICNRRATQPPTHFQRNPLGRGRLAVFALLARPVSIQIWALRSRLEKQPTDLRRCHHYMRDGTLQDC